MNKLTELREQVQQLFQDRDNTKTKLQCSERDCVLLSEMQNENVHNEEKCQLLRKVIDDKQREIQQLQEELKQKESKLECAQQEAKALQKKLSKVQHELKVKHEGMMKLQKEKEELIRSYREIVSKLAQSNFALTSDRDEMKVQSFLHRTKCHRMTSYLSLFFFVLVSLSNN